jgi:hypothetical protein
MSTASSMRLLLYPVLAALLAGGMACNRNKKTVEPDEQGRLRRIAQNLETAYAKAPLPPMTEPPSLLDRLDKWDDFRSCTVRTYVARKREADRRARDGLPARPSRHASIGDETVEECAVQMAVAKKESAICERLALDYEGPGGEMPLSAVRCWDTRARVFGLPDECPVVWMSADAPARNPECLAMARRDSSLCPFTESPGRCRTLLSGDRAGCSAPDGAPDCELALEYWRGSIPSGFGPALVTPDAFKDKPLSATIDLRWTDNAHPQVRIQGPRAATAISWPAGKSKPAYTEETTKFWGGELPAEAAQVTWRLGDPAIKLAFVPGGAGAGVRELAPPSPSAAATFVAVWADDPARFLRCLPGPLTKGEVRFQVDELRPGGVVSGEAKASKLSCSDGSELELRATFRLLILDLR